MVDIALTRGLRQTDARGGVDWRELVIDVICGVWRVPDTQSQTQKAEAGLGIGGSPYYFYALRAEEDFGFVVLMLRETEGINWPSEARGATPFDSGGLWFGKVKTDPALDGAGRRMFFRHQEVPLAGWRLAFETYIQTRYRAVSEYRKGQPPNAGGASQSPVASIVSGSPNSARAWTWEVRIPHRLVADRLELHAAYMTDHDRDRLYDWVRHSSLPVSESRRVQRWVKDHVVVPTGDESVVLAANA